ncbi:hypothetical protein BC830DRAFT_330325 [Chytriomyces sp. MP71]|nr:hypothetical protein BC830DRAFT_330325 [Chytriomyces sp. MP71]
MSCFPVLPNTATMPDFVGYQIHQHSNFTDTQTLDAFVRTTLDSNTAYIEQFRQTFNCPNWNGTNQRFHQTFFQGSLVFVSQAQDNCPPPAAPVQNRMICQSSCQAATTSLNDIFSTCTLPDKGNIRSSTIALYNQVCKPLTNTNCIVAVKAEALICGFGLQSDFQAYCAPNGRGTKSNDTCCTMPLTTLGTEAATAPTRSNTAIIVISGLVGFLVLILLLVCACLRRRNKVAVDKEKNRQAPSVNGISQDRDMLPIIKDTGFDNDDIEDVPPSPVRENSFNRRTLARGGLPTRRDSVITQSTANSFNLNSAFQRPSLPPGILPPPPMLSPSPSALQELGPSKTLKRKTFLFDAKAPVDSLPATMFSIWEDPDVPGPGDVAVVVHQYETNLRDEMQLMPGEFVQVHVVYEDGWAHGSASGTRFGAFPLV